MSARQVFLAQLFLGLWFAKGDIVAGEMCVRERCCCNCPGRFVASAGVMLVTVSGRDPKLERDLVVLDVEADSEEEPEEVLGLEVGNIAVAVVAADG